MADVGGQQVGAAEDNTNMATEEPQQESGLLSIAPELRNAIYELAVTGLTSTLHVETITSESSHQKQRTDPSDITQGTVLRFDLGLPALYYACRSTHDEFPLARFYANNTFVFTDCITHPKILDALMSTCPDAVKAMRSIKVKISRTSIPTRIFTERPSSCSFELCRLDNGEIKSDELLTTAKEASDHSAYDVYKSWPLAEEGTRQNHSAVVVLRAFVGTLEHAGPPPDRFRWYHRETGSCPGCGSPD
ncbi:hypothetical protein LTS10_013048 [Elasticomyces elasticus]|nr:hypothetical protein LTS10_013048 [Elasticomyces elasticus]